MSYVIQNFSFKTELIIITPRLRFLVVLKSLKFFFVFFKLSFFFKLFNNTVFLSTAHCTTMYNHLFNKQLAKILRNLNLTLLGNYTNNVTKAAIFHTLNNTYMHFKKNRQYSNLRLCWRQYLLYNIVFLSVKVANNKINKKFYQNTFFTLLLYLSQIWFPHSLLFSFPLNFFFINYSNQMFRFYNGHFWKIYNF